jgi:hypothetical protein
MKQNDGFFFNLRCPHKQFEAVHSQWFLLCIDFLSVRRLVVGRSPMASCCQPSTIDKNPCGADKGDVGVWISKRALTTTRRHTTQLTSNRNTILFPL